MTGNSPRPSPTDDGPPVRLWRLTERAAPWGSIRWRVTQVGDGGVIILDCYGLCVPMNVRVTAVVIEDDQILLLDQDTEGDRSWSLPGGKVEPGETIEEALEREVREETGLEVRAGDLLYVCDVTKAHVVHLTFECRRVGGTLGAVTPGVDTRPIRAVEFVKLTDLPSLGFSERFVELARAGWPDAGSYMGPKSNIGL